MDFLDASSVREEHNPRASSLPFLLNTD